MHENLRFLIVEVNGQLSALQSFLIQPSAALGRRILERSGYAENLKARIHNTSLQELAAGPEEGVNTQALRAIEAITTHLQHMVEHVREVVRQSQYLSRPKALDGTRYQSMLEQLLRGLALVESAFCERDSNLAMQIGEIESSLDRDYRRLLKRYTKQLQRKRRSADLLCLIFIAHYLEQMGDEMLGISEAILSANLGQVFNIDRYQQLSASVAKLGEREGLDDLVVEPIAETRSGSAIAGIASPERGRQGFDAIYKDGGKRKLKEERQGVENWHEIFPGLAPRILSYHKRGQSAALLIEHLAGLTFEQILLHEPNKLLRQALRQLTHTLRSIWRETGTKKRVSADYTGQLCKRLGDVYAVHPEFRQGGARVAGLELVAFDRLLERAMAYEQGIQAPFSVYIHGDFNVDNIIYDPGEQRINFIDLHRSRYMDYVQDVTVFMVSIYRLQVLDSQVRRRILGLAVEFCRFARGYARKRGDRTFEIRLALGLARSFATSPRFILDKSLSRAMFLRARYLLEQVLRVDPRAAKRFRVPVEELFVG